MAAGTCSDRHGSFVVLNDSRVMSWCDWGFPLGCVGLLAPLSAWGEGVQQTSLATSSLQHTITNSSYSPWSQVLTAPLGSSCPSAGPWPTQPNAPAWQCSATAAHADAAAIAAAAVAERGVPIWRAGQPARREREATGPIQLPRPHGFSTI